MSEFKFTKEQLDVNDRIAALTILLMKKGIFTDEELNEALDVIVEVKNEKLSEEREKNAGMSMLLDIMTGNFKGKEK